MSERRCPHCGGLVTEDAEWCGQCLNRLAAPGAVAEPEARPATMPRPEQPAPAPVQQAPQPLPRPRRAAVGEDPFRMVDGRMVWTCPRCGMENAMEESVCPRCGATFGTLFREPEVRERVPPNRAMGFSLIFPGLGHFVAHQAAEGIARAVLFLWAFGSLTGIILVREGGGSSFGNTFVFVYGAASLALYGITAMDAYRAAEGRPPVAPIRHQFYAAGALMAITVGALLFGFGGG